MHRIILAFSLCGLLCACTRVDGRQNEKDAGIQQAGRSGDRMQQKTVPGTAHEPRHKTHVRLLRNDVPAAARVSIVGSDGRSYAPVGAAVRKTKRDEPYFYADDSFDVELPAGRVRMNVSGGLETIPQKLTVDAEAAVDLDVRIQHWQDSLRGASGWYSG